VDYFNEIIHIYHKISMDHIEVTAAVCDVKIKSERIVYFGLIFNELLANSYEHNKNNAKKILIRVSRLDNDFVFDYCDNSEFKETAVFGMGLELVKQLVKRVKGSVSDLDKKTGQYKFIFKTNV
jgi:two-component sensor histidine kinase